jgi:hypothetical protein
LRPDQERQEPLHDPSSYSGRKEERSAISRNNSAVPADDDAIGHPPGQASRIEATTLSLDEEIRDLHRRVARARGLEIESR